jgi:DNA-directed RNA polymerase subunit K/omega
MNEKLLDIIKKIIPDRRLLINGASKRAAELARGGRAMVPVNPQDEISFLDIALMEIAEGKIVISAKKKDE